MKHLAGRKSTILFILFSVLMYGLAPIRVSAASKHAATAKHDTQKPSRTLTLPQLVKRVMPSIVRLMVRDKDGAVAVQGSGFVVGDDLITTNLHVIKGAHAVTADFQSGRSEAVFGVVGGDPDHDLVLLRAFTKGVPALPLAEASDVQVGDSVVAFGSPEGLGGSISTGVVSGIRVENGTKIIQTTAPISHGSSGGALIDMQGRVVGVTSFFNADGQNLNFAYPTYYVRQMKSHQLPTLITWSAAEKYTSKVAVAPSSPQTAPSSSTSLAADTAVYTDKPLAGLKGVYVYVTSIEDDAKKDGLDGDAIKKDTELALRQAGIPVVDKLSTDPNNPEAFLFVGINTLLANTNAFYAYSVNLDALESVTLRRPVPVYVDGTTWSSHPIVGYTKKDSVAGVANTVKGCVDEFVKAYLAQNPKSP